MQISIVVINYNYASYLRQAVDSALAQTHPDTEVVVVDDGSTDGSRDIIASYGSRIRPVLRENGGLTVACNTGWRNARGDAVLFLDADDVLLPEMAAKVSAAFEASDAVKVQFALLKVDGALRPTGGCFPTYGFSKRPPRQDIAQWGYYLTPPQSGNVYRKSFLDEILPAIETGPYPLPMDGYATGLAGLTGRVATLDETLGLYRIHGSNMSEAGQVGTVGKIRTLFMRDYVREQVQAQWAERMGLMPVQADRSRFHPTVCKQRLIAYRLDPVGHPVASDGRWGLLLAGLWGAVRFPYLTLGKRCFVAVAFVGVAVMPLPLLRRIAEGALSPTHRPSFRQFLAIGWRRA